MTDCPSLPALKPGQNAVNNHIEVTRLYSQCRNRVRGWIDWYTTTEATQ